jgi:prepilin-type N-terminal cleavage/methylation domain-containing protein
MSITAKPELVFPAFQGADLRQKGMTLLEVIITLGILSVLFIFSNQSIQNALKSKLKIQNQVDDLGQLRDGLKIMEKDINLAFHYRDVETELQSEIQKMSIKPPQQPPPTIPKPNRQDPVTQLIGTSDSLYFSTLSASRMIEGSKQADFIRVGYFLTGCKKLNSSPSRGQCLVRSTSPVVEGDPSQGEGDDAVLLENVTEFKLRYIGKGKQDWTSEWNTKVGDGATNNTFPQAVEISVTTERPEPNSNLAKKYSMQIVANIHFLNNSTNAPSSKPPGAP